MATVAMMPWVCVSSARLDDAVDSRVFRDDFCCCDVVDGW